MESQVSVQKKHANLGHRASFDTWATSQRAKRTKKKPAFPQRTTRSRRALTSPFLRISLRRTSIFAPLVPASNSCSDSILPNDLAVPAIATFNLKILGQGELLQPPLAYWSGRFIFCKIARKR